MQHVEAQSPALSVGFCGRHKVENMDRHQVACDYVPMSQPVWNPALNCYIGYVWSYDAKSWTPYMQSSNGIVNMSAVEASAKFMRRDRSRSPSLSSYYSSAGYSVSCSRRSRARSASSHSSMVSQSASEGSLASVISAQLERRRGHSNERRRGHSNERRRGHSNERRRGHSNERRRGHSNERRRGHSNERPRGHSNERRRCHSNERRRCHDPCNSKPRSSRRMPRDAWDCSPRRSRERGSRLELRSRQPSRDLQETRSFIGRGPPQNYLSRRGTRVFNSKRGFGGTKPSGRVKPKAHRKRGGRRVQARRAAARLAKEGASAFAAAGANE